MPSSPHVTRSRGLGRPLIVAALAAGAFSLGACASRGGSVPYEPAGFGPPDVEALTGTPAQQRIAPQDKLRISVFQVADLTGEFTVDAAGAIQFPLIGSVTVGGRLPDEVAQDIERRLGERYLNAPDVQVAVVERTQQTITVEGAVRQPGVMPIRGATTLIRAVAMAEGTAPEANPARVVVFRTIDGQRMAAAFDLRAIRRGEAEDPPIYGNDIVVVDGSRSRAIWRDVLATIPVLGLFRPF